jgi:hypothetical protein
MILGMVEEEGFFKKLVTLPSGGDCSYPGMIIKDDFLYVSYYSSHETKSSIYFASLRLNKILELTEKKIVPNPIIMKNEMGSVELKSDLQNSYIRYTLDGSIPSARNGIKYEGPIKISSTKILRAVSFAKDYLESSVSSFIVGEDLYEEAIAADGGYDAGLSYNYFDSEFSQVDEMQYRSFTEKGISENVTNAFSPKDENYGYQFSGLIKVPEDGLYTFFLESNDGSILKLNDRIIINNDGPHGRLEEKGYLSLRKGYLKIKIGYFQQGGGAFLKLSWESDNFEKEEIPANVFFH